MYECSEHMHTSAEANLAECFVVRRNSKSETVAPERCASELGSILVETTIIMPVFLMLLVAFVDVARFMHLQACLTYALERGLHNAAHTAMIHADSNAAFGAYTNQCGTETENEIEWVTDLYVNEALAHELTNGTVVLQYPSLTRPASSLEVPMVEALRTTPITLEMDVTFYPLSAFMGFGPISFTKSAQAYIQPHAQTRMPIVSLGS